MKSKIKLVLLTAMITLGAIFQFTSTARAVTYTTDYIKQENWYLAYPQSGLSTQREAQFLINGETVFCIDPYTDFKSKVTMEVVDWSVMGISKETAKEISLISYFGTKVTGRTDNDWYGVTQGLIWKTLHPNDPDLCYVVTPLNPDLATTQKLWNEILADVENYKTLPSFSAQTVEVNAGETITLTDTNGVLKDMHVADDGGLSVTISGNNLIIKGAADSSDLANITLVKKINDEDIGTSLAFYNGKDQSLAQFKISDPVQTKIRVKVNKYGSLELTKNNNYGNIVDGAVFNISSDNGYNENHTVSNGKLFVDNLLVGTYAIKEVSAPYRYVVNTNTYEVEVKPDTTSKLTVTDDFDYGKLELDKTNTNGDLIDGSVFNVSGTDFANGEYSENHTVKDGKLVVDKLVPGTYYVKEVSAPNGYLLNATTYVIEIKPVETSSKTVINQEPKASIGLRKLDRETGTPQGDATLKGAKYGVYASEDIYNTAGTVKIYSKDELITTKTTDANGEITFTDLVIGNYYVKEISPSVGYLLDTTRYDVSLTYKDQYTSIVTHSVKVYETVIKRPFHITKISTNGDTGIQTPESGAIFEVYLKSSGILHDTLTTDSNGHAQSIFLPYGVYVVKQVYSPNDTELCQPFEVVINENSSTPLYYVLNNAPFETRLKLLKLDEDTGLSILSPNASFKIYDLDKETYLVQKVGDVKYDTFSTDENGKLVTPLSIPSGHYRIEEVTSPEGYLLDTKGLEITISSLNGYEVDEDGDPILTVTYTNKAVKGEIQILKSCEYSKVPLNGITYDLMARNDILATWDKTTVLYKAGEVVDTKTTDGNGKITFSNLYLGDYYVVEKDTLSNYILDSTEFDVSLEYKDNKTAIIYKTLELTNKPTETVISKKDVTGEDELIGAHLKVVDKDNIVIDEWVSTEESHIIRGLNKGETYTLIEEIAPNGYVISSSVDFVVNEDGTTTKVYMIDKMVQVSKTDVTGEEELEGAHLQIVDKDGNIIDEWISTKEVHYAQGLKEGDTYTLIETISPEEYTVSSSIEFTVSSDKKTQLIHMVDKQVAVTKMDFVTGEELEGAHLQIIDKEGNIVEEWISSNKPYCTSNLKDGETYTLIETLAPNGYYIAESIEFVVTYDKQTQILEMKDMPILTTILINKADIDTNTNILNLDFEFTLYADKDLKEVIATIKANQSTGTVEFTNLRYGTYYIAETKAPKGYQLGNKVIEIVIDDDFEYVGEIATYIYLNEKEPEVNTGDSTSIFAYVGLALSVVIIAGGCYYFSRKNKENEFNELEEVED